MKKIYEFSVSTARDADMLAESYGYGRAADLAAALPEKAVVVDVGAGLSPFGCTVADKRPDITWVNTDRRFPRLIPEAHRMFRHHVFGHPVPENVHYVKDDILHTHLPPDYADRVFSSALLPHIIISSRERGLQAVHNMAGLLKEEGKLAVGSFGDFWLDEVAHVTAEAYRAEPDAEAARVVDTLALTPSEARALRIEVLFRRFLPDPDIYG